MQILGQDGRLVLRGLRRAKGFTALVVATLAIGIAATTSVFSVIETVLLTPLPYAAPDRLVRLYETFPLADGNGLGSVSVPNFRDWQAARGVERMAAYERTSLSLQEGGEPERLRAVEATPELFDVLGVVPALGRPFAAGEADAVVLGHALWQRAFAGDEGMVGRTIRLDGRAREVVGVMPEGFDFPPSAQATDLWIPLEPDERETMRGNHWLAVIGRLGPGATAEAALDELAAIARGIEHAYPDEQEGRSVELIPLEEVVTGDLRPALLVLFGAAVLVLLIACGNAANLLLVRAAGRRREVATRAALGAGGGRIAAGLLFEALLLAAAGTIAGLLLAHLVLELLGSVALANLPRGSEVAFDGRVFAFATAVALLAAGLSGLVPALQVARGRLFVDLREGARGGVDRRSHRWRSGLVVAQIALSAVLLVGAGLLVRTLFGLLSVETGMRSEGVLAAAVTLPGQRYPDDAARARFFAAAEQRIAALPGVAEVGWISHLPLQEWGSNGNFGIVGRPEPATAAEAPFAEIRVVTPGYFAALGIPVVQGRNLDGRETAEAPAVLVNERLAREYFPDGAVGERLILGDDPAGIEIVGVVGDVRQAQLEAEPRAELYLPASAISGPNMSLVVLSALSPEAMAGPLAAAVREVDPGLPVYGTVPMTRVVADAVGGRRLYLGLLGGFAACALALALAGIYGVIAQSVAAREREIGVRIALGAEARGVLALVLGHGALLALLGLGIGIPAAIALARFLEGVLYGVEATDAATLAGVGAVLAVGALLASWWPARRAAAVDPAGALRAE